MKNTKYLFILMLLLSASEHINAQNTFKAIILDKDEKEPLTGTVVSIKGTTTAASADKDGKVILANIPDGKQVLEFMFVGFQTRVDTFLFPLKNEEFITIYLEEANEELEEIVVSSTRSSRTISDIPTRIETVAAEELEEKGADQPGNIKAILTESTGIQTQQTSATSANASIRIQGLDGGYTQLLKDGFPLYSGFSDGLSIMQIPPLDLQRVEVIKGSASTLYGGGAIAGLINLITKVPTEKRELTFMVNGTSAKGLDFSGYYNQKFKKTGITLFVAQNSQEAYDPAKSGFSAIPQYTRYTFNPKFFYYINPTATISLGLNTTFENRLGGDMQVISGKADTAHTYFERDISNRYSTQLKFEKNFKNKAVLTAKNSISLFSKSTQIPNYYFNGRQTASYSELSFLLPKEKTEWITGLNAWTDQFKEAPDSTITKLNYSRLTIGAFIQNHWNITTKLVSETGLRLDYVNTNSPNQSSKNNLFLLPRLSLLYKFSNKLTSRLGGGLGYKAPTVFTQQEETQVFQFIQPINIQTCTAEKSIGGNFDINYRTQLSDEVTFSINEMLFYTVVNQPLMLYYNSTNKMDEFVNANGFIATMGSETNMKIKYEDIALYCGYTYIDAQKHFNKTDSINPLTAKSRLNLMAMYEVENKLRVGFEAFYVSPQTLTDGSITHDYWIMGISAEKKFKHFSLFINAENLFDTRQTRFQPMYAGSIHNPQFGEIWAPLDGRIINGGFKIML